ncbi:polyprenyl diphosphate synthase [Streptomyces sp. NPDC003832]
MTDPTLHVALIMDGNGRWARLRGMPRSEGHLQAQHAVQSTVDAALAQGVTHLTLFAFSTENWNRPADEVKVLMQPGRWLITAEQAVAYRRAHVQITFVGDRSDPRLPASCLQWIGDLEQRTAQPRARLHLTVAFNYGGRQEITEAVRRAQTQAADASGTLPDFRNYLWTKTLPDIDLLVRTSGEYRLSNFMLWSLWYAELAFTRTLWPDFRGCDLEQALTDFRRRSRRWGTAPLPPEQAPPIPPGHGAGRADNASLTESG